MIPGKQIGSGSDAITVAPMNLRIQLETCKDDLEIAGDATRTQMERANAGLNIILACARRNHPMLTREQLCEQLDAADVWPLVGWVLTKSGFQQVPLEPSVPSQPAGATPSDSSSMPPAGSPTTSSIA